LRVVILKQVAHQGDEVRSSFRADKARANNGHSAAVFAFGGSTFFVLLVVAAGVVLGPKPVSALPSFARRSAKARLVQ